MPAHQANRMNSKHNAVIIAAPCFSHISENDHLALSLGMANSVIILSVEYVFFKNAS